MAIFERLRERPLLRALRGQERAEQLWKHVTFVDWDPVSLTVTLTVEGRKVNVENVAEVHGENIMRATLGGVMEYGEAASGEAQLEFRDADAWTEPIEYDLVALFVEQE